jgi:predicted metal-dependent HD superfamily phosphohydrolase
MINKVLESISFKNSFNGNVNELIKCWTEPHRYFHTLTHLGRILKLIENDRDKLSDIEYDILRVAAIYHDIIWLPREDKYNVAESIEKFKDDFYDLDFVYKDKISDIIDSTNFHNFNHEDKLIRMFNSYDMNGVLNGDLQTLIEDGDNVAKEFNLDINIYKQKRIEFLKKYKKYNPNIQLCIGLFNEK